MKLFGLKSICILAGVTTSGVGLMYYILNCYWSRKSEVDKDPKGIVNSHKLSISRVDKRGRLPLHIAASTKNSDTAQGFLYIVAPKKVTCEQ